MDILLESPESLFGQHRLLITELADSKLIGNLVVNEAHSILNVGYGRKSKSGKKKKAFRPAYSWLLEVRAMLGDLPSVVLTATLTAAAQHKLMGELNMTPCFSLIIPPQTDKNKYISYSLSKDGDLDTYFQWLKEIIEEEGKDMRITCFFP